MAIYEAALGACTNTCAAPPEQVPSPSFCETKIIATDTTVVGFLNCEVSATSTPPLGASGGNPTLLELQALITAEKLTFKAVQNFNKPFEERQTVEIDPFIPAIFTGATQSITFEDNYFDLTAETDRLYWDDKAELANQKRLHFVTINKDDVVTFYRIPVSLNQQFSYDATGKNVARRQFTVSMMWSDDKVQGWNPYIVAGAYAAFVNQ
jgi:hypothetical protein